MRTSINEIEENYFANFFLSGREEKKQKSFPPYKMSAAEGVPPTPIPVPAADNDPIPNENNKDGTAQVQSIVEKKKTFTERAGEAVEKVSELGTYIAKGTENPILRGILITVLAFVIIFGWFAPIIKDTNASIAIIVVDIVLAIYVLFLINQSGWKGKGAPYIALFVALILDFIITILIVISSKPLEYMMNPGIIFAKGVVSVIYGYFFYHILKTIIDKKNNSEGPADVSAVAAPAAVASTTPERYRHALSRKFKL